VPDTPTRIYIITDNLTGTDVLVRAPDRHKALRWVMSSRFNVALATQDNLEEMLTDGMRVQRADESTEDDEPDDPDVTAGLFDEEPTEAEHRALPTS
jgi:hypothetical protein